LRVLVAEDDRGLREALSRGLRENSYIVDAVPDGAAAMRFVRSYEYAIAVLDWRMPEMSGLDPALRGSLRIRNFWQSINSPSSILKIK
jgi:DNA-binding response OmpR family regulator